MSKKQKFNATTRKHWVNGLNGTISLRADHNLFLKMPVKVTKLQEGVEYFHFFYTTFWSKNLSKAEQMTKLAFTFAVMFHLL